MKQCLFEQHLVIFTADLRLGETKPVAAPGNSLASEQPLSPKHPVTKPTMGVFRNVAGNKRTIDGRFKAHSPSHGSAAAQSPLQKLLPTLRSRPQPTVNANVPVTSTETPRNSFPQEFLPPTPHTSTSTPKDGDDLTTRLIKAMDAAGPSSGTPYIIEEKELLMHLKEDRELRWEDIEKYFPHRKSWASMQSQYSGRLKGRYVPKYRGTQTLAPHSELQSSNIRKRSLRVQDKRALESESSFKDEDLEMMDRAETHHEFFEPTMNAIRPLRHHRPRHEGISTLGEVQPAISSIQLRHLDSKPRTKIRPPLRYTSSPGLLTDELDRSRAALSSMTQKLARSPAIQNRQNRNTHTRKRQSLHVYRPYLDKPERDFLEHSGDKDIWTVDPNVFMQWNSEILHVDFTEDEANILEASLRSLRPRDRFPASPKRASSPTKRIREMLAFANNQEIDHLAFRAVSHGDFINRTVDSITSFIRDVINGHVASKTVIQRLNSRDTSRSSLDSLLRDRELGTGTRRATKSAVPQVMAQMYDTLGPTLSFNGTSSDINCVTWSPNGEHFAIGSAALTDLSSMQYNRQNNLLLGRINDSVLWELPDHAIKRDAHFGVNATHAMQASQDPYLFTTVSAIEFAESNIMLSAGYDSCVRLWEVNTEDSPSLAYRVPCQRPVDLLSVTRLGLFATAKKSSGDAIRVWKYDIDASGEIENCKKYARLESQQAVDGIRYQIEPSCLRWNPLTTSPQFLLGGFSARDDEQRHGETCLWDLQAERLVGLSINKRNVFDAVWSPSIFGRFAVGCGADGMVNRGTKSVIRIYDSRWIPASARLITNTWRTFEMECPASDMNDVVFNRRDDFLLSSGCTNGKVYVWDLRSPNQCLHQFEHGEPLVELDASRPREAADTGVRFLSWDGAGRLLYSGSSDGVVAAWNPYLAPEDALHRHVIQLNTGVMAGSFSPDFSNLLLGDVQGCATMLSVGNEDKTLRDCDEFKFIDAVEKKQEMHENFTNMDGTQGPENVQQPVIDMKDVIQIPTNPGLIANDDGVYDSGASKSRIPRQGTEAPMQCLRCESELISANPVLDDDVRLNEVLVCLNCRQAWRVNALGYQTEDLIELGEPPVPAVSTPEPTKEVRKTRLAPVRVPEHIHNMWEIEKGLKRQLRIAQS